MKKTVDKIPFYRLGWNKTIFIVEMCQNVPEEIRKKGQFVTNEV
jgi:hypothetical protein